jgi:GT2 family glycosyltransferase
MHKQWIDHIDDLAADFLEKESIRLSDCMISQEGEILNWMKTNGWQLPQQVVFIPKESNEIDYQNLYKKIQADQLQRSSLLSAIKQEVSKPLVSICVTHFNRPHYLAQILESIRSQDYPHFEVILVDDASTQPEAIAYLDRLTEEFELKQWKIIRNKKNLFPGAARNLAVRQSNGDYLLFMDDDNYAKPDQISTFVKVAQQVNADILTCAMDVFIGSKAPDQNVQPIHRFLPMGAAASVGLYLNMFGDMNALMKRTVYEALNGLTEERGVGGEDWELYSRAVLQGYHLETIPLALFWYRDTPSSITKTTHLYANSLRGIRSYLEAVPPALQGNLMMSQAQHEKLQKLLIEHNSLGKLLKRCWQLFSSRVWRAMRHPHRSIKKLLGLLRR